ncbi:MAG: pantoate--beta-alanine ligase [Wenzhouxiangella sp.]
MTEPSGKAVAAVSRLAGLRSQIGRWRSAGERIALVPTMGNLHAGHLALVEAAGRQADRVVVSIFVNPTQFGPNEDFAAYPRTLRQDLLALGQSGCDLAWCPEVDTMYPLDNGFRVTVPEWLASKLCGRFRPGHFDGVASVVLRLFNQVQPDLALFGEKDFQQLLVLRWLARDLSLPIEVLGHPTQRDDDGLALSSRNQYLSASERATAPLLYGHLRQLADGLEAGRDWSNLKESALWALEEAGFKPQYLAWCSAEDLGPPRPDEPQRLLVAAWLGKARLIDNLPINPRR